MKKILILINNLKIGGAERVASIIANNMSEQYEVHIFINESEINYPINKNINIHILYGGKYPKPIKIISKLFHYWKLVREIRPDSIYAFANSSAMYGAFCKILLKGHVILISSERTDPTREPTNPLMVRLRDLSYSYSDYLVCQTLWVKDFFEKRGIKAKCVVIPNPITPDLPKWKGQNSNFIMTACRLEPQKNLPLLISVFKKIHMSHPELVLKIFGEGYLREELEILVRNEGLSQCVFLPGFSTDIYNEMATSRLYVSSSDYEGISNSMLEALGIGLPVVHTDCPVGGASMFIKDGENGLLVAVNDEVGLYNAIIKIVEDSYVADLFSKTSISVNQELSVDIITKKWLQLFPMMKTWKDIL